MPKISTNAGHTHRAPGASGHIDEVTEDRLVRAAVERYLRAAGWEVHDSTTEEATSDADLAMICRKANASGADYFMSIHFNSSDGTGTGVEVYYSPNSKSSWGKTMATKISAALSSLMGIRNRGAKAKDFYVIRNTDMPAILIETCFVDNAGDAAAYRRVGPDAIGKCIAACITGKTATATTPAPAPSKPAATPAKPSKPKQMTVDGDWGTTTNTRLQETFGTPVDGEIWHQWAPNKQPAFVSGWRYDKSQDGSPLVRAMQRWLGVDPDGIWGEETTLALQHKMGTTPDGELWRHSPCVMEMQRRLNAGTLV